MENRNNPRCTIKTDENSTNLSLIFCSKITINNGNNKTGLARKPITFYRLLNCFSTLKLFEQSNELVLY